MPTKSIIERMRSYPDERYKSLSLKDIYDAATAPKYYAIYLAGDSDAPGSGHIKEFSTLREAIEYAYELCPTEPDMVDIIKGVEIYER